MGVLTKSTGPLLWVAVRVGCLAVILWLTGCAGGTGANSVGAGTSGTAAPIPREVATDLAVRYPGDQYLLGVGYAHSPQAAVELARGDLAEKIRVRVATLTSDIVRERNGRTEQEISTIVVASANELMEGVSIEAQGLDAESGMHYAVATLPKEKLDDMSGSLGHARLPDPLAPAPPAVTEPIWVTTEGVVSFGSDMTLSEAASRSLQEARRLAVEAATAAFVTAHRVVYNAEVTEEVVRTRVRGIILDEEVLDAGIREVRDDTGLVALFYATTLRAHVKPMPVGDDNFAVHVSLNRTVFHDGEEVRVTIVSSRDAYVYAFSVGQDDSVRLLFPNGYAQDNFVSAQQELVIPSDLQRELGVRLRVSLPQHEPRAIERVKVLATAQPLPSQMSHERQGTLPVTSETPGASITDVMKQVASLENVPWAEMTVPYEIRR